MHRIYKALHFSSFICVVIEGSFPFQRENTVSLNKMYYNVCTGVMMHLASQAMYVTLY